MVIDYYIPRVTDHRYKPYTIIFADNLACQFIVLRILAANSCMFNIPGHMQDTGLIFIYNIEMKTGNHEFQHKGGATSRGANNMYAFHVFCMLANN